MGALDGLGATAPVGLRGHAVRTAPLGSGPQAATDVQQKSDEDRRHHTQ